MLYPRYANDLLLFAPHVLSPVQSMCRASLTPRVTLHLLNTTRASQCLHNCLIQAQSSQLPTRWHEHPGVPGCRLPCSSQQPAVYKLVNHITPRTSASTQSIAPICILKVLGRTQHRRRQWGRTLLMPAPRNPPCPARELLPPTGDPCPIRYSAQVTAVRAGASRIVGSCRSAASLVVISSGGLF